jgi:hypothetical protein
MLVGPALGIGGELGQMLGIVPGTYDVVDLLLCIVATIVSVTVIVRLRRQSRMKTAWYQTRLLLTTAGFIIFLLLAAGSEDSESVYVPPPPPPPPQEQGRVAAKAWARSNSESLAAKMQEIDGERRNAEAELDQLRTLIEQFPGQSAKIAEAIDAWKQVVISLDAAMVALERRLAVAYVAYQVEGADQQTLLDKIFGEWVTDADRALAKAREQRLEPTSFGQAGNTGS